VVEGGGGMPGGHTQQSVKVASSSPNLDPPVWVRGESEYNGGGERGESHFL